MKKLVTAVLATAFAVSLSSSAAIAMADTDKAEGRAADVWNKTTTASDSAVTVTDREGGVKAVIQKTGNAFGGVTLDLSEEMAAEAAAAHKGGILALSFKLKNGVALENSHLAMRAGFKDGSTWEIGDVNLKDRSLPDLGVVAETEVVVDLTTIPSGKAAENIVSLTVGVDGAENAQIEIYDLAIKYSDYVAVPPEKALVACEPASNQLLTSYQYGDNTAGTSTKVENLVDADKSKDADGSVVRVSINGTGNLAGNFYAAYFDLRQQQSMDLNEPAGISFWVYNHKSIGGELVFIDGANARITDVKTYGADGQEIAGGSRNLDYTGFRRYELTMTAAQLAMPQLQIALHNPEEGSAYDLSAFSVIDMRVPDGFDRALTDLAFTNFSTTGSMQKLEGTDATKSKAADGKYVGISRTECENFDMSSVYMQNFKVIVPEAADNPTSVSFWVYNASNVANGGLMFKFGENEVYPAKWVDEEGNTGNDRDLNYVGFRKYTINIEAQHLTANEFQLGIWGTSAAEVYFSEFSVYDKVVSSLDELDGTEVAISAADAVKVEASFTDSLTQGDNTVYAVESVNSYGSSYIQRNLDGIVDDNASGIKIDAEAQVTGESKVSINLIYDDGSGVDALYPAVSSAKFTGGSLTLDFASMPYYIAPSTVTGLRIGVSGNGTASLDISGVSAVSGTAKQVYSYVLSDFENAADVSAWGIASDPDAIGTRSYTTDAKVGKGAMAYDLISGNAENFTWSEVSIAVGGLIEKNTDKDIYGLSFWMYNESYIPVGTFGFWIKVAMKNAAEYEVKSTYVKTEYNTQNSMGFTGWQKIEVPLSSEAYGECADYSHTGLPFDWKQLGYIKIGFWGYAAGCNTILDDVRLVSGKQLTLGAQTYNIVYNLNGGKLPSDAAATYEVGKEYTLPTPTRDGYTFEGWYSDSSLVGDKVTKITAESSGDVTVYAAWKENKKKSGCNSVIGSSAVAAGALAAVAAVAVVQKISRKRKTDD